MRQVPVCRIRWQFEQKGAVSVFGIHLIDDGIGGSMRSVNGVRAVRLSLGLTTLGAVIISIASVVSVGAAVTLNSVTLNWTATGDDGNSGIATQYAIRYYDAPITVQNWGLSNVVDYSSTPQLAGTPESVTVVGLSPGTLYYFAIRAADEVGNWSPLSNVISVTTLSNRPIASFDGSSTNGCAPLAVAFNDLSTGGVTSWQWDFGDGNSSAVQNPNHVYQYAGLFTVTLVASNSDGADTAIGLNFVTVDPACTVKSFALSDRTVRGDVAGSYVATHTDDTDYQVLSEVESSGKRSNRFSRLDHRWQFIATSGNSLTLNVRAYRPNNSENDNFIFEYSTDNVNFIPSLTVNSSTEQLFSSDLPNNLSDTVYIRVVDSDHRFGNLIFDRLYVNQLYLESSTAVASPETLFVAGVNVVRIGGKGGRYQGRASVLVHSSDLKPAVGVTVYGQFSGNSSEALSSVTGANGVALFETRKVKGLSSSWCFGVDDIRFNENIYDPALNLESSNCEVIAPRIAALPGSYQLEQNYPNPFNPSTQISFSLPESHGDVRLEVFDVTGRLVATLKAGPVEAGDHTIEWDGSRAASGVYFYRLTAGEFRETRKMVLVK